MAENTEQPPAVTPPDNANVGGDTPDTNIQDRSTWVPPGRLKEETDKRRQLENQLAERTKSDETAAAKKLEDDGKLKELLDLERVKSDKVSTDFAQFKLDSILRQKVSAHINIADATQKDANTELMFNNLNRSIISINDDGTISGFDDEIGRLKTAHASNFGNGETTETPPANPNSTTTATKPGATKVTSREFKTSDEVWALSDAEFLKVAKAKGLFKR